MGSISNPLKVPVIDFSVPDLKPGSLEWESLKSEVIKAAREYGFFEALFNKISPDLKQQTVSAVQDLFDLPLETKQRNTSEKTFHGYVGPTPVSPLFETMAFEDPNILHNVDGATSKFWPQGNPTFSKILQSYSEQISELDQIVRRMIVESVGLQKYLDEHMNSTNYLLRVMKYKEPETTQAKVGLTTHTDKNVLSILLQNHVSGLQFLTKDGEWITAQLTAPHSFIVIIGDSLHAWTNGRTYSPIHRVVMTGYEARYTIGMFSKPKAGYIIKAPEEVIDEEYPLLYKPWEFMEYLDYYQTEAGQNDPFPLKTFCGV